jgi:hypothetical protein
MADISYSVEAAFKVGGVGTIASEMDRAAKGADSLQGAFDRLTGGGRQLASGLVDVASRVVATAAQMAGLGVGVAAAATAIGVKEVGKNLSMLENKSIQLTAVVAAATEQQFGAVRGQTDQLFAQFRKDAITSAGETSDFVDTAAKLAGPLLGAGKSMADLREITKGVIATAPALGASFGQAGSDVMRMLQGGAGADLPFFKALQSIPSLGIKSAEAFNKLDIDKRIELIQKALGNPAFQAASDMAGDTLTGLMSTVSDLGKTLGGFAVSPVFERVKRSLKGLTTDVIADIDSGGPLTRGFQNLGLTIATRFDDITASLHRLFPSWRDSAGGALAYLNRAADVGLKGVATGIDWLASRWPAIVGGAKEFAGYVSDAATKATDLVRALGGGDIEKGMQRALGLFAGGKVASAVAPGALEMGKGGLGLAKELGPSVAEWLAKKAAPKAAGAAPALSGGLEVLAGMGSANGLTTAFGPAVAAEGLGAGVAGEAGVAAAATAAGASLSTVALGIAALAAAVGVAWLAIDTDTFGWFHRIKAKFLDLQDSAEPVIRQLGGFWDALGLLATSLKPLGGLLANLAYAPAAAAIYTVVTALNLMMPAIDAAVGGLRRITNVFTSFINTITDSVSEMAVKLGIRGKKLEGVEEDRLEHKLEVNGLPAFAMGATLGPGIKPPTGPKDTKAGKQEVTVTLKLDLGESNEDAIYIRSARDFANAITAAKGAIRTSPMRNAFG